MSISKIPITRFKFEIYGDVPCGWSPFSYLLDVSRLENGVMGFYEHIHFKNILKLEQKKAETCYNIVIGRQWVYSL